MTLKRKHRLVVEVTLDNACTERDAIRQLQDQLYAGRHADRGGRRWTREPGDATVKSFERAVRARVQSGDTLAAARAAALGASSAAERLKAVVAKLEESLP